MFRPRRHRAAARTLTPAVVFAVAAMVTSPGCGGGPTTPTAPLASSIITLLPGTYALTLAAGAPPGASVGTSISTMLCASVGGALPTSTRATVPVELVLDAETWRVSSDDGGLTVRFSRDGNVLSGAGAGRTKATDGITVELGRGSAAAQLVGRIGPGGYVEGSVEGGLAFWQGNDSISCSPSRFEMSPR